MTTVTHYVIGAFWGPRKESPATCARRIQELLRGLSCWHPSASWGATGLRGENPLAMDTQALAQALGGMESITGRDDSLGTLITCWPGDPETALGPGVHIQFGGTAPEAVNSCRILSPEPFAPTLNRPATPATLVAMLRAMTLAWDPDWGWAARDAPLTPLEAASTTDTHVGWLTYITRRWGEVPAGLAAERVETLAGRGSIIVLPEVLLVHETAESVTQALEVQRRLLEHGVLRRLTPELMES